MMIPAIDLRFSPQMEVGLTDLYEDWKMHSWRCNICWSLCGTIILWISRLEQCMSGLEMSYQTDASKITATIGPLLVPQIVPLPVVAGQPSISLVSTL